MDNQQAVRVRIAPSPTGPLHVGTARAALYNELFARQHHGQFIIRIEDTDSVRSKPEFERDILEGLAWLGLTWDEGPDVGGDFGPYRQSQRRELYRDAIQQLLDTDQAYKEGEAVRLRVAAQEISFSDLIRGSLTLHPDAWGGDFVIARSLDQPVYHLAVVVDDAAMKITHIIRGEDHLSNTAKHILIQRALGYVQPVYAHLPLLLNEQRHKLSKREGETSVLTYRDMGYLPEALLNSLALLGWNPGDDQEVFSHEELIRRFSLKRVQKAGAIFSLHKLDSLNKHYLRQLTPAALFEKAKPFLEKAGFSLDDVSYWQHAVATEQHRLTRLGELPDAVQLYKPDWQSAYSAQLLIWEKSSKEATKNVLGRLLAYLKALPTSDFTEAKLKQTLFAWIEEAGLDRGEVLWPMRVALTGKEHSAGPFEVASVLGKEATLARLQKANEKL